MIELAACRTIYRNPQRDNACWADVERGDKLDQCGHTATPTPDLGLCPKHLTELFGIQAGAS